MLPSRLPLFHAPPPLQVFMKMIQGWGERERGEGADPTFFHIWWWLCPNPFLFSVVLLQFSEKKRGQTKDGEETACSTPRFSPRVTTEHTQVNK